MKIRSFLAERRTGFNCATMEQIADALRLGCDPLDITFTMPYKTRSSLIFAAEKGVLKISFDTIDELKQIARFHKNAKLMLRIATFKTPTVERSRVQSKVGVHPRDAQRLLEAARQLDVQVIGICFHIEAEEKRPQLFSQAMVGALADVRAVIEKALSMKIHISLLNLGGGFSPFELDELAPKIREALGQNFSDKIETIAEPGRYFAGAALTIACCVIGKRTSLSVDMESRSPDLIFVNDSIYDNFSILAECPLPAEAWVFREAHAPWRLSVDECDSESSLYSIRGCTATTKDTLISTCFSSHVLEVGDWIMFDKIGSMLARSSTSSPWIIRAGLSDNAAGYFESPSTKTEARIRSHRTVYLDHNGSGPFQT